MKKLLRRWRERRLIWARRSMYHWKYQRIAAPECQVYYARCVRRVARLERKLGLR
jgi:hypothetical protein